MPARADAAELIVSVVTAVAANVGSIDELLAGRAGSWEADAVRQLLEAATGGDEQVLAEQRTAPIDVRVSVYDLLQHAGVYQAWQDAENEALSSIAHSVGPMAAHDGAVDDQLVEAAEDFSRRRTHALQAYRDQLAAAIKDAAVRRGYDVPGTVTVIDHGIPGADPEYTLLQDALHKVDLPLP